MPDGIMIVPQDTPSIFWWVHGYPTRGGQTQKGPAKFLWSVRCNGSLQAGDWPGTLTSWDYRRYSWQDVRFFTSPDSSTKPCLEMESPSKDWCNWCDCKKPVLSITSSGEIGFWEHDIEASKMQGRARGRKGERKTYHINPYHHITMEFGGYLLNVAKNPTRARARKGEAQGVLSYQKATGIFDIVQCCLNWALVWLPWVLTRQDCIIFW